MQIVLSSEDGIVISITGLGNYNINPTYKHGDSIIERDKRSNPLTCATSLQFNGNNKADLVAGFPAAASRYAASISSIAVVK